MFHMINLGKFLILCLSRCGVCVYVCMCVRECERIITKYVKIIILL